MPEAILLDVQAPKLSGLEVLRKLKNDPDLRDIPVFMLGEQERKDIVERCFESGASEYLGKAHLIPGDVARNVKRALRLS